MLRKVHQLYSAAREGRIASGLLWRGQALTDKAQNRLENEKHKRSNPYYRHFYASDPMKDRRAKLDDAVQSAIIRRITQAYLRAKSVQPQQAPPYQIGRQWQGIYETNYRPLIDALRKQDEDELKALFANCFRSTITRGLEMGTDYLKYRDRGFDSWYANAYLGNFNTWVQLFRGVRSLNELSFPLIGNPFGPVIEGHFIPRCSIRQSYHAARLAGLMRSVDTPVVCEIGAGFGGMGYHLLKHHSRKAHYIDFDLPETLAIATYFLLNAFPDKQVLLFGEGDLSSKRLATFDIVLMPNFILQNLEDGSVDAVFNSDSLVEMELETIQEYVMQIGRVCRDVFLHFNHDGTDFRKSFLYSGTPAKPFGLISAARLEGTNLRRISMTPALFESRHHYECVYRCA